jgi:predicted nuclease with TOPRIM domain
MDKEFIESFIMRLTPDDAVFAADKIHDVFGVSSDQTSLIKDLKNGIESMTKEKDEQYDRAENLSEELSDCRRDLENETKEKEELTEEYQETLEGYKETIEELEKELDELKNESPDAQLRQLSEAYMLSDSQYYQDELLKILENEYNLALIVAPANNQ